MSKRTKVEGKEGIYYRTNSNDEKIFYYTFKNQDGKTVEKKVGSFEDGFRVSHAIEQRAKAIRKDVLGETVSKSGTTLDQVAFEFFYINKNKQWIINPKRKNAIKDIQRYNNYIGCINQYIDDKIQEYQHQISTANKRDANRMLHQVQLLQTKSRSSLIGSNDVSQINEKHLEKVIRKCEDESLQPKTTESIYGLLSSILSFAVERKYISLHPISKKWKSQHIEPTDNACERYLTDDEIDMLLNKVSDNQILSTFIMIGLYCGARAEAILDLRKIDIVGDTITIGDHKKKGNARYKIPLKQSLKEYLQLDELKQGDYLIGRSSNKITYNAIVQQARKVFDELFNSGLDFKKDRKHWVSIHTLRHTFASRLAIAGCNILTLKKLMNHSDIKMTLRYAHLTNDSGAEFLEKL